LSNGLQVFGYVGNFYLFTMWTKYNLLRGGKKESRNRTDSFESEPLDKRSPASFFTTYPRTSTTTTSFILSGPPFFIFSSHHTSFSFTCLQLRPTQLRLICIYAPSDLSEVFFLSINSPSLLPIKYRNG
jgi:hypothetical protein